MWRDVLPLLAAAVVFLLGARLLRVGLRSFCGVPSAAKRHSGARACAMPLRSRVNPTTTWPVRRVRGVTFAGAMAGAPVAGLPQSAICD